MILRSDGAKVAMNLPSDNFLAIAFKHCFHMVEGSAEACAKDMLRIAVETELADSDNYLTW